MNFVDCAVGLLLDYKYIGMGGRRSRPPAKLAQPDQKINVDLNKTN